MTASPNGTMASVDSAPSPSLTHASSADDADFLDNYLDPSVFSGERALKASSSTGAADAALTGGPSLQPEVQIADYSSGGMSSEQQLYSFDPDQFWRYVCRVSNDRLDCAPV